MPLDKQAHLMTVMIVLESGACPGFLKGGGPIFLGSLKKRSSDFKRGGVQLSEGGGSSTFVSL